MTLPDTGRLIQSVFNCSCYLQVVGILLVEDDACRKDNPFRGMTNCDDLKRVERDKGSPKLTSQHYLHATQKTHNNKRACQVKRLNVNAHMCTDTFGMALSHPLLNCIM